MKKMLATLALALVAPVALAQTVTEIDISGLASWDANGDVDNVVFNVPLAPGAQVIGVGWDVILEPTDAGPFGGSWYRESTIGLESTDQAEGLFVSPGADDAFGGPFEPIAYSSGGILDLVPDALDFAVGADGLLRVELFESFDDADGEIDATWLTSSVVSVQWVPEPASALLLALGAVAVIRRR